MRRVVQPELLDSLPAENPEATRSRTDLRRVNAWMGHRRILARVMDSLPATKVRRIVELGAGDGTFALSLAEKLRQRWPKVEITLVDQQRLASSETLDRFSQLSWTARVVQSDVFEFLPHSPSADLIFTNLFLHHFDTVRLRQLLHDASAHCSFFTALEPRRRRIARLGCELLGLIGCNRITRHDARVSVRAGFVAQELSSFWPDTSDWTLREEATGLFSHLFVATRNSV